MVVATQSRYFTPGVNQAMAGLPGLGLNPSITGAADATPSYGSWDFLQDITRGGLDIIKGIVTPPSYESATTPSGASSTKIRYPGASTSPTGSTTQVAGQIPGMFAGINTNTLLIAGAAIVAVILLSKRNSY